MITEGLQTIFAAAGGAILGGGFLGWLTRRYIAKVDQVLIEVAKLSTMIRCLGEIKQDVKEHEKRITLLEPKIEAAHRRLDDISTH